MKTNTQNWIIVRSYLVALRPFAQMRMLWRGRSEAALYWKGGWNAAKAFFLSLSYKVREEEALQNLLRSFKHFLFETVVVEETFIRHSKAVKLSCLFKTIIWNNFHRVFFQNWRLIIICAIHFDAQEIL